MLLAGSRYQTEAAVVTLKTVSTLRPKGPLEFCNVAPELPPMMNSLRIQTNSPNRQFKLTML